jgi:Flp pilus assembly protein TadD
MKNVSYSDTDLNENKRKEVFMKKLREKKERKGKDEATYNYEMADMYFNRGTKLIDKGRYSEAIEELLLALKYEPDMPEALNNLGYAYHKIGMNKKAYFFSRRCFKVVEEIIKAMDIVDKKVNLSRHFSLMLANAGTIMDQNNDPDAKRCLELAVRLAPKNWIARCNLGAHYHLKGLIEDALREYQIAYKLNKHDHDLVFNLSGCYGLLHMEEEAIEIVEKYLKKHPPTPDLLVRLVCAYGNLDRTEEANNICEQWIRLEPDSPVAHAGLGLGYAILGRKEEAYQEIATAIKLNEKVKDEVAEEWIKSALEILEEPDNNTKLFLFYLLLAMMKARRKGIHKYF